MGDLKGEQIGKRPPKSLLIMGLEIVVYAFLLVVCGWQLKCLNLITYSISYPILPRSNHLKATKLGQNARMATATQLEDGNSNSPSSYSYSSC